MDCATAANLVGPIACQLNSTHTDEMDGLVLLCLVAVAGLFIMGSVFVDSVIKPWRR